jgi:hypothetical protein
VERDEENDRARRLRDLYDWYDSALYEQTIRVDGTHQIDVIVQNPGFPVVEGGGTRLPASIIRSSSLEQPIIQQASIGMERPLAAWADFRTDYMWTRGSNTLRSINVNAPVNGVRPDPTVGNITEIQSTGRARLGSLHRVAERALHPAPHHRHGDVSVRQHANYADNATSLPSNSLDPNADWGPSAQDVRHRVFFNFNTPLGNGVRVGLNVQGSSALPYNITTGLRCQRRHDLQRSSAGVGPQQRRGASQWTTNVRFNKSIGLGGQRSGPPTMPMPPGPPPPGGGAMSQRVRWRRTGRSGRRRRSADGGDGGRQRQGTVSTCSANIQNAFNNVNYNAFIGNQLSPFFGTPTSAMPPRRIELGLLAGLLKK